VRARCASPADVDAVAIVFRRDHGAFEREALDDVRHDVAHRIVDSRALAARPISEKITLPLAEWNLTSVRNVSLSWRRCPSRSCRRSRAGACPASPCGDALDAELALLDLGLQRLGRHLSERRNLKSWFARDCSAAPRRPSGPRRRVADDAVDADADRLGRGRVEIALQRDRAIELDRGLPCPGM